VDEPTRHLRALARQLVDAALERVPLRAALLAGSAGRGDADFYSDLDLLLYVDELPPQETLAEIRTAVGGTKPTTMPEPPEHLRYENFDLDGVRTELTFVTIARTEWRLDQLLVRLEEIDGSHQKALAGMLEALPLYGEDVVEHWQERLRHYPEPLRRAMIERYWDFFPLWYYGEAISARDGELWRVDMLLQGAFNVLGVLAGLNRLYFTRFELKRMRALISRMELAPPELADRLESLFRLEPVAAAAELGRLVEETRALVAQELPDVELSLEYPPSTRQRPWRT
jgi:hypothetical protein